MKICHKHFYSFLSYCASQKSFEPVFLYFGEVWDMLARFRNKMFMFDEIVKWNNASKFSIILEKDPNCVSYYKTKLAQRKK